MTHELFGKLRFKAADESWAGSAQLPRFAAVGQLPEPVPLTEGEAVRLAAGMNAALEAMKAQMRERFGEKAERAFAEADRAALRAERETRAAHEDAGPDHAEREQRRVARREKRAALLAKGRFPVRIAGPGGAGPAPAQEASFRALLTNEGAVYDAVLAELWAAFQSAFGQDLWRLIAGIKPAAGPADLTGRFAVARADITREARGGFAHIVFSIESDWQDERGLMVVYSPDAQSARWTSRDGLDDLLESDEPGAEQDEYVPTPHDLLLEAILTADDAKARELVAAGADINALGPGEYPPLWIAVDQLEVEEVRRLLAHGADPNLANPDERTTPLKHAKRMHLEMGFAPPRQRDELLDSVLSVVREAAGEKFNEIRCRLEVIIRLLEGAAG